jgi:hypothetical protein
VSKRLGGNVKKAGALNDSMLGFLIRGDSTVFSGGRRRLQVRLRCGRRRSTIKMTQLSDKRKVM